MVSLECAVDSEWNGEINFVVTCSVVELFAHKVHQKISLPMAQELSKILCILTTVHATTKSFVPFCLPQYVESTDMNCLVFWTHCENGKILTKRQVYNKGIFTNFG